MVVYRIFERSFSQRRWCRQPWLEAAKVTVEQAKQCDQNAAQWSFRASNEFTEYRRSVGVEEVVKGRRRSLVNFHSFRRYFITKAEQADQTPIIPPLEHRLAPIIDTDRSAS
jgi:hypothetical protein